MLIPCISEINAKAGRLGLEALCYLPFNKMAGTVTLNTSLYPSLLTGSASAMMYGHALHTVLSGVTLLRFSPFLHKCGIMRHTAGHPKIWTG